MKQKIFTFLHWPIEKCRRGWQWYRSLYIGQPWWRKAMAAFVSFLIFCFVYAFAVQVNLFWLFGDCPSVNDVMHPRTQQASEVYSEDEQLLHKFFNENRSPVSYDEISPNFVHALISTEDERFYKHRGIDFVGLFAAAKDAMRGHARGASTITQQLVKNVYNMRSKHAGLLGHIPGVRMIIMKSKEMVLATEIEMLNEKDDILTMYANTVDFGSNAFGIKTAAKTYFGTTPSDLKVEEAAMLVGLLKATTAYNPKINPKNALKRRNIVIDNMVRHKMLTRAEGDSIKELPIELKFNVENVYDGKALYFRNAIRSEFKQLQESGRIASDLDLYEDGLRIISTLDSRMQRYAEEAVQQQMQQIQRNFNSHWGTQNPWVDAHNNPIPGFLEDKIRETDYYRYLAARYPDNPEIIREKLREKHNVRLYSYDGTTKEAYMSSLDSLAYMLHFMHTGFVAIEPETGNVRAYVGDINYKTWQHDNVRASHQPGSTFKLFVYATAMKNGLTPADRRRDEYIQMEVYDKGKKTVWRPHNADGYISGANLPLRSAFARSINTVAVKLGQEFGISSVINTARDMGITSELVNAPSLPLGACDVTPYELISAYTTVANYGTHVEAHCIQRILDRNGKVLYEAKPKSHIALSEKEAFFMQVLLNAGVTEGGGTSQTLGSSTYLGPWLWDKRLSVGGKTGTSNSHADAWFVGVTPKLVGGAWVGGQYRQIHFRNGQLGQGSRTALPIFGIFMRKVLEDKTLAPRYTATFREPVGVDPTLASEVQQYVPVDTLATDSLAVSDEMTVDAVEGLTDEVAPEASEASAPAATRDDDDLFN